MTTALTRTLGRTGLTVSRIGFGAFKIGRNENVKYPTAYDLPDEATAHRLLNDLIDAGVCYIDTAPAYGLSEERIGRAIAHRRHEFTLSTKVGETFAGGRSTYDFSATAVRTSIDRSLKRLQSDILDVVFIHANSDDVQILTQTDVVETLQQLKSAGKMRAIGFSGKTAEAAELALEWADALMVEYHIDDRTHEAVIGKAAARGIGIVVKKGLASGHLPPRDAIRFVLQNRDVDTLIVGGLNLQHMRANLAVAHEL